MVLSPTRRTSNNKENSIKRSLLRPKPFARQHRKQTAAGSHKGCLASPAEPHPAATTSVPSSNILSVSSEDDDHSSSGSVSSEDIPQQKKSSEDIPVLKNIKLPRRLLRPTFRPISLASISAIDPNLAEVPIEYIHQKLKDAGGRMFAATMKATVNCKKPLDRLPHELEIIINGPSPDVPTHILAVYVSRPKFVWHEIALFSVHGIVLAAHCANLPSLPHSRPQGGATKVTLPVLPLSLPCVKAFCLLLPYLYTHRTHDLLSGLFPVAMGDSSPLDHLKNIAETCTVSTILTSIYITHGLWGSVAALGIFDDTLFRIIDYAWATLLGALSMKTGENWHT